VSLKETAYVGNDINDAQCLAAVGLPVIVADAHPAVQHLAAYRTTWPGGHGAVREVCDLIASVREQEAGHGAQPSKPEEQAATRMVGNIAISYAAFLTGCMVCPNCGDTKFGSTTMPDGSLVRTCHGSISDEEPCGFRWPSTDDHLYYHIPLQHVLSKIDSL
jgi:hypothetical protein